MSSMAITKRLQTYIDFWAWLSMLFPDAIWEAEDEIAGHQAFGSDALRYQMLRIYLKPGGSPATMVWNFKNINKTFWEKVVAGSMPAGTRWFERFGMICHLPVTIDEYSAFIRHVQPKKEATCDLRATRARSTTVASSSTLASGSGW